MKLKVLLFTCILLSIVSKAQQKIAIVNEAERRLYFEYVALTIFGNSDDSIPCDFNTAIYTEETLSSFLSDKYQVTKINLPVELQHSQWGIGLRKWIKSLNGKFDKVIIISSIGMTDYAHSTNAYLIGSGLYSRMGIATELYNTIVYRVFNTSDGKSISTSLPGFNHIKGYVYSETKNQFNPEMCDFVISGLKEFINETMTEDLVYTNLFSKEEMFVLTNSRSLEVPPSINYAQQQNLRDSSLVTGWYYTTDQAVGFKRNLDKSDQTYYIDPKPIVIQTNFGSVEMFETNFRGSRPDYAGLTIVLDDYGRRAFGLATSKSYDNHLALIINNKLVSAPLVKTIVTDGFTFLRRGEYNSEDVKGFMKELGIEESK